MNPRLQALFKISIGNCWFRSKSRATSLLNSLLQNQRPPSGFPSVLHLNRNSYLTNALGQDNFRSEILRIMIHSVISHSKACHSRPAIVVRVNSSGNPTRSRRKPGAILNTGFRVKPNDKTVQDSATMYANPNEAKTPQLGAKLVICSPDQVLARSGHNKD